jgi:hypothetical protein
MTTLNIGVGKVGKVGQMGRGIGLTLGLALGGCASSSGAVGPLASDVRGNSSVSGKEARPLVVGPTRLLHANFDRKAQIKFYRVWQRGGAIADCRNGVPLGWDGESEIEIQKDELVCVTGSTRAGISWHARSVAADAPQAARHASLP